MTDRWDRLHQTWLLVLLFALIHTFSAGRRICARVSHTTLHTVLEIVAFSAPPQLVVESYSSKYTHTRTHTRKTVKQTLVGNGVKGRNVIYMNNLKV